MKQENTFRRWMREPGSRTIALLAIISVSSMLLAAYATYLSRRALDQARDSVRISQRPYITLESIRLAELPNADRPLAAEPLIKNSGATPALNLRASQRIDVVPMPPADTPHEYSAADGRITVGPHSTGALRVAGEKLLTAEELRQIDSGELRIYVIGTIVYEDVFQLIHETAFCASFTPRQKSDPLVLAPCPELNAVR